SLPLEYQEIRAPAMLPAYRRLMQVVWGTIDTAFSNKVITPGRTTTDDIAWWMRQRVTDLGFGTWFHTDVDVQRRGVDLSDSGAGAHWHDLHPPDRRPRTRGRAARRSVGPPRRGARARGREPDPQ